MKVHTPKTQYTYMYNEKVRDLDKITHVDATDALSSYSLKSLPDF